MNFETSRRASRRLISLSLMVVLVLGAVTAAALARTPTRGASVGDFYLRPGKLTIHKGTRVTWKWKGFLGHNVTATKGPQRFHSRTMRSGSYSHLFTRRGTYRLECTIHPQMRETIVVN